MSLQDEYIPGDYNATCFECGRKFKASTLKKHWQGYWVCSEHWEPRHSQDFVRAVPDIQTVPWSQPQNDILLLKCDISGMSSIAERAVASCMIAGRPYVFSS